MATIASNVITSGLRGKFGDAVVFKTMRGKTFASPPCRIPDRRKESAAQRGTRTHFKEASGWAQQILLDPERKAYYRQRAKALKLPNAYTAALTDYMRKANVTSVRNGNTVTYTVSKPGFEIQNVSIHAAEGTEAPPPHVIIRQRKERWLVEQRLDYSSVDAFTLRVIDSCDKMTLFRITAE